MLHISFFPWQYRSRWPGLVIGLVGLILMPGCQMGAGPAKLSSGLTDSFYAKVGTKISQVVVQEVGLEITEINSLGSVQNLERLEAKEVDLALTQLDVAVAKMRQRQIQAIAVLGSEPVHILTTKTSGIQNLSQLRNKRVGIGAKGSGVNQTARILLEAEGLTIQADESPWNQAGENLVSGKLDAVIYVGSVGASVRLREWLKDHPEIVLVPIPETLINYLAIRDPDAYQPAVIPKGTYLANPPMPAVDIPTLSTATVLVTRPDANEQVVGLVAWSILDSAREFSGFYPALQTGNPNQLLQQGLFYLHPAAADVYKLGDPRSAWARYWENNNDLQAGVLILGGTSGLGILLRYVRHQRAEKLMSTTTKRISELKQLLPEFPDQAIAGVEALNQEHRLMFIDGKIAADVYDQVQHKTQRLAEQCQVLIQEKRNQSILNTLLLVDEWQATLQTRPEEALDKLKHLRVQYRQMLIENQVNIQDYIELMELTLMSLTTFAPTYIQKFSESTLTQPRSWPSPPEPTQSLE